MKPDIRQMRPDIRQVKPDNQYNKISGNKIDIRILDTKKGRISGQSDIRCDHSLSYKSSKAYEVGSLIGYEVCNILGK